MNWHEPSEEEWEGKGDYKYIVDIIPDSAPHQAGVDGNALFRIGKPGWSWGILDVDPRAVHVTMGYADTREAAVADSIAALAKVREEDKPKPQGDPSAQVAPHEFISLTSWFHKNKCRRCYLPREQHPTTKYENARPLGDKS